MNERHTIAILLENASGALSRVSGLFSARAYNIESLAVAPTEDPTVSRPASPIRRALRLPVRA